ncbi:MAG: HYR domain-containing protein, partial [Flavobacteriaceae bacterium]|nr:HYR domain-containing protein [Flavobacteriaceae bacterium]
MNKVTLLSRFSIFSIFLFCSNSLISQNSENKDSYIIAQTKYYGAVTVDTLHVSLNENDEPAIITVNGEIVCEDDFETLTERPETFVPKNQKLSPTSDFKGNPKNEILDKRDRTSKHYLREDGTAIDAIISPTSLHYLDKSNNWQDIETDIRSSDKNGYVYANTTNNLRSYFSADPSSDGILIETERANLLSGKNLTMNWIDSTGISLSSLDSKASYPRIQSNTIEYKNIFPNVDNQFVVENDKLKHNYILQQRPNIPKEAEHLSFSEEIQLPANWKMDFDENRSGLIIMDEANTVYLQIPFPVVYEKDNQSSGIAEDTLSRYDLKSLGNGKFKVSTMVSVQYLADSSYPIVIDPPIVLNGNYSGFIWYDYNYNWKSGSSYCGSNYNNTNYQFRAYNAYDARVSYYNNYSASYSSYCTYSCSRWHSRRCRDNYNYGYQYIDSYKGWIKYDTSAIPDGATINSVGFRGVVASGNYQNMNTSIYSSGLQGGYSTSTSSYNYNQITQYYHGAANYGSSGTYPIANLNASASTRLQSLLTDNYFQIGLYSSTNSYSNGFPIKYFNTAQSELHVSYSVPCTNIADAPQDPFPYDAATDVCFDGGGAVTALAWTQVPEATSYDVYFGTSVTPGLFQANLATTFTTANLNLAANTQYYWKVVPKNDCSTFTNVSTWNFTTAGAACSNEGCTFDFDFVSPITKVTFATIDNPSSASTSSPSYENFTPISTTVSEGSTQSLRVEANTGTTGSVAERTLYVNAFFDWNQDGDFTDAGESYYVGQIFNSTGLDGNFAQNTGINIPNTGNNVLLGDITMRVIASRYNNTDPCESDPDNTDSTYGQTEDYTVNLCGLPVASCQNITVDLNEFGIASIEAADVDNGSTAPCGLLSMEISHTIFNCSDVGDNTVTLTITDEFGNVASCDAIVTIVDVEAPSITCQPNQVVDSDPGLCTADITLTPPIVDDNCGGVENGLNFAGAADYVSLGDLGLVTDWTIETWFKRDELNNYENLFHSDDLAGNTGIRMEMSSNFSAGKLYVYGTSGNYTIVPHSDPDTIINNWHHVAVVGDQTNGKFYIYLDGVEKVNVSPTNFLNSFPDFVIGRGFNAGTDRDFNGDIDEFRIWNVARSQAEIQANMNNSLGAQAGLLASLNLNQGVPGGNNAGETTAFDASGNDNNGTLNGFTLNGPTSNWVEGNGTNNLQITNDAPSPFPIGVTIVTWTVEDEAGNTAYCEQTVTVIDTADPIITVGASNRTVECDGNGNTTALNGWLSSNGDGGAATDNCDNITWSNDFTALSNGCGETGSATVTFTATDPSGNSVNTIATFTIEDTTSPSLSGVPSDITVECDAIPTAANPTASDTCDANPDIAFNEFKQYCQFADAYFAGASDWTDLDGDGFGEFIRYNDNNTNNGGSFIGSSGQIDSSGSSWGLWANGDTSNIVRFFDTPMSSGDTFSILMDNGSINNLGTVGFALQNASAGNLLEFYFIGGQSNYYLNSLGGQTDTGIPFTDQGLSLSFTLVSATDVIVEITQLASNTVSTYNLEVLNPGDQTIGKIRMFNANAGGGNDQFFNNIKHCIETNTVPDGGCASNYTLARTWTATDDCGNTTSGQQTITVVDTTAPSIDTAASDETVECDGLGNTAALTAWLNSNGGASASDTCGNVTWSNDYSALSDDCGATGSATVTFTATDDCGNTSTTTATFTIEDTTDPILTLPADVTIECTEDESSANTGVATGSDTCSGVQITQSSTEVTECGNTKVITRTWTATDDCGNTTSGQQTITVVDTTAPSID